MTTRKQCETCQRIVRWEPPEIKRLKACVIYPLTCPGGNALILCPGVSLVPTQSENNV